ncbi:MAG: alginate lyase family protein [Gammaproteobacteria bacterium]
MNARKFAVKAGRRAWVQLVRFGRLAAPPEFSSAFSLPEQRFLQEFDIAAVAAELGRGDREAARQALLRHYGNRTEPPWPSFPHRFTDAASLSPEALLAQAADIQAHRFGAERLWLGDKIDWLHNPTPDPMARWTRDLHRHRWLAVLARAYEKTGDEEYARTFVNLIVDWIFSNPPPARKDEANVAWTLMGVGMRATIWPAAFAAFYRSPAFTDEAKLNMLRSIYDHAQFLCTFKTRLNHVLRESNGLACLSIYFPEFKRARFWQQTAIARLEQELEDHVNEDGTSVEMSIGYQWLVTDEFDATRALLREHGQNLPTADLDVSVSKLYAALAYVLRPDGNWPRLDDGFMEEDGIQRKKLAAAGAALGRQDFVFIATGGQQGQKPERNSVAFENAGLYIMRSDWTHDARYLLFDTGQFSGYHGHEDKLSIEVHAHGQSFIVDPGCYTYNTTDPYRAYFISSRAHNTAMVAGLSQVRRWERSNLDPIRTRHQQGIWVSRPEFDYAEGTYNDGYGAYAFQRPPKARIVHDVSHTRRVLFVKPDYWLIIDELQSMRGKQDFEIIFNAAPDIDMASVDARRSCLNARHNDACLYLIAECSLTLESQTVIGSERPIQGWYANGWNGKKVPAPTLIRRVKGAESVLTATLLYPCRGQQRVDLQALEVRGGSGLAYQVTSGLGVDYLMLSSDRRLKTFGPCESSASIAGFRASADGPRQLFNWR